MATYTLLNGHALELPELAAPVQAYLDVIRAAADNPDIDYATLFQLVHSPANPLLPADPGGSGGVVLTPAVLADPAYRVMTDLLGRKGLAVSDRSLEAVAAQYDVPVSAAAEALGISPRSVRQALTDARLAGAKRNGEWLTSAAAVDAYKVTQRGPRSDQVGERLTINAGGAHGYGLKFRADTRAKQSTVDGSGATHEVADWTRLEVLTYRKGDDKARYMKLVPGEDEDLFQHGQFFVRGRFEIVEKVNNARDARQAWKRGATLEIARRAMQAHGLPTDEP